MFVKSVVMGVMLLSVSNAWGIQDETSDIDHLETLWSELGSNESERVTSAVLGFSKTPKGTVEFLDAKVMSIRLDEETFTELLSQLCSDDEEAAKAANVKLRYLDPRLMMPIADLIEKHESMRGEPRVAEVFMDREYGALGDVEVAYGFKDFGNGDIASGYQIGNSNYWVSPNLELLCELTGRASWTRMERVIKILEHIGTPEAIRLVSRLGQGDPNCPPTKLARTVGLKLKSKDSDNE